MNTLIPKIIHYCWFGEGEMPSQQQIFLKEWKMYLKDYQFIKWDERNSPMYLTYMQNAYKAKKWANLSNYTRLHALYLHGGIYLDTDIKIIKKLDIFLKNICFLGFEADDISKRHCVNNAVMGAIPRFNFVKELKTKLLSDFDGTEAASLSSPVLTSSYLKKLGLSKYGLQKIAGITLYPKEYFYPYSWDETFTENCIKEQTYTIHFWAKSWWPNNNKLKESLPQKKSLYLYFRNKVVSFIIRKILHKEHIASQIAEKLNQKRIQDVFKTPQIIQGIFKGIKYTETENTSKSLYAKLLGVYENHLHQYLYKLIDNQYKKIINIGGNKGYYAIGLAKLFPDTKVEVYETDEESINLCNYNIIINKLDKQILTFQDLFTAENIKRLDSKQKYFIFSEYRGSENFIFIKKNVYFLKNTDLIIKLHESTYPNVKLKILTIFQDTHEVFVVSENNYLPQYNSIRSLDNIYLKDINKLVNKNKSETIYWAIIYSRADVQT